MFSLSFPASFCSFIATLSFSFFNAFLFPVAL